MKIRLLKNVTIAHPLSLFLGVWGMTFLLFSLHLSEWLDFSTADVVRSMAWICLPFVLAVVFFTVFYDLSPKMRSGVQRDIEDPEYLGRVERSMDRWFYCWIALTVVEVGFSGGLPIIWLLTGSPKLYFEFGLPVIHVLVWTLLAVLAIGKLGLYLLYGNRRRLFIPAFQIFWGIIIVSRGLIMGALVQAAILWLCLRPVRLKTIFRGVAVSVLIVLMFGYMGDIRSGASSFRDLARPTNNYPQWLPSGVLWVYIYATSPLANLVHTTITTKPADDPFFSRTILFMVPTPLRNAIYGNEFFKDQEAGGDLITPALTVSSAYVGPYLDEGFFGMGCYSALLGVISAYCWRRRGGFRGKLRYVIIGQCLVFSIFWNFLFYNPLLGQVFWIYLIFARKQLTVGIHRRRRDLFVPQSAIR